MLRLLKVTISAVVCFFLIQQTPEGHTCCRLTLAKPIKETKKIGATTTPYYHIINKKSEFAFLVLTRDIKFIKPKRKKKMGRPRKPLNRTKEIISLLNELIFSNSRILGFQI